MKYNKLIQDKIPEIIKAKIFIFFNKFPAKPTFPAAEAAEYHQRLTLLLPSSERDRVGHDKLNYREIIEENLQLLSEFSNPKRGMRRLIMTY